MSEMLYKKYRPSNFEDFFGNNHVSTIIKNSILRSKLSHAYLFNGPRGTGKTSLARLIAKSINCLNIRDGFDPCTKCENCIAISKGNYPDLIELDAASNRGIDEIRDLKDKINYLPISGKYKIYILDEVHMLTKEAFNALLKTLEEPPKHVIFILATTELSKIPDTIVSRCQSHTLQLMDRESMLERLKSIMLSENREMDDESYNLVMRESGYSMRDSLSILEKILIAYPENRITLDMVEISLGLISKDILNKFYNYYVSKDSYSMLEIIDFCWEKGYSIHKLFVGLADFLRERVSSKDLSNIPDISKIYTLLNDFRLESNKRAVGYVIVNNLIQILDTKKTDKVEIEKIEEETKKIVLEEVKEKEVEKIVGEKEAKIRSKEILLETEKRKKEKIKDIANEKKIIKEQEYITEKNMASKDNVKDFFVNFWPEILKKLKEKKLSLMIFLTSATILRVDDKEIEIAYNEDHKFHKESISKKENLMILEDITSKVLGRDILFKISYTKSIDLDSNFESRVKEFLNDIEK
jgi:DNA polymerase-3 subunit gamma/tau